MKHNLDDDTYVHTYVDEVFDVRHVLVVGGSILEAINETNKIGKGEGCFVGPEPDQRLSIDGWSEMSCVDGKYAVLIWLHEFDTERPGCHALLSHEIFHAASFVLNYIAETAGATGNTEEMWAYYIGYLTKMSMRHLHDKVDNKPANAPGKGKGRGGKGKTNQGSLRRQPGG